MGSFPFTYLGLPLKPTTLSKMEWQPILDRIDKRLASWKGHTLSRGGRLILVNSVLTNLPLYHVILFPSAVGNHHIDRLRRAFLWKADRSVTGGNAWLAGKFFVLHAVWVDLIYTDSYILILPSQNSGGSFWTTTNPLGCKWLTSIVINAGGFWTSKRSFQAEFPLFGIKFSKQHKLSR